MHHQFALPTVLFLMTACGLSAPMASTPPAPRPTMDVLVEGARLPAYAARGTWYIEALKGREYEIRLLNPYPVRVAVALSVDGLNTIDARHTAAAEGRKWVIEPYASITISGWQTSLTHARRFEFTSEEQSYGQWLGKTDDLGIISAVFYRERTAERLVSGDRFGMPRAEAPAPAPSGQSRNGAAPPAQASASSAGGADAKQAERSAAAAEDEYAATGIGRQTDHTVRQVYLDLESTPAASLSLRYEYRAQLVRLGVLPARPAESDAMDRRERARGFAPGFCPEPKR